MFFAEWTFLTGPSAANESGKSVLSKPPPQKKKTTKQINAIHACMYTGILTGTHSYMIQAERVNNFIKQNSYYYWCRK